MKIKKTAVLFSIEDKNTNNLLHNILVIFENRKQQDYIDQIQQLNESLYQVFQRDSYRIGLIQVSNIDDTKGKIVPLPHTLYFDLFYSYDGNFTTAFFKEILESIKAEKPYLPAIVPTTVVRSNDFFNYEDFITSLWKELKTKHIILTAPRRFGKTSLLYNFLDNPKEDFRPIFFDLESISDNTSFIIEVIISLKRVKWVNEYKSISKFIQGSFKSASELDIVQYREELQIRFRKKWQENWSFLINSINKDSAKILFLFDEFSSMLENLLEKQDHSANELIEVLHKSIPKIKSARFILTGSSLLRRIFEEINYPQNDEFINLFDELHLTPIKKEKAFELTQRLLAYRQIIPKKEFVETILGLLGTPIPSFIQLLVSKLPQKLTKEEIINVYKNKLLSSECKAYFKYYYEHIYRYRRGRYDYSVAVKDILDELTKGKMGYDELRLLFNT
ncbi:hypothetical protein KAU34_09695, partial [candidate division WOR-3 bacterium]|nr:hypothetical protein [candidate division WOR-3 bacterium]